MEADIATLTTEKGTLATDLTTAEADYAEMQRKKEESDAAKKTNDETNAPEVDAVVPVEAPDLTPSATGDDLTKFVPVNTNGPAAGGVSGAAPVASGPQA